MSEHIEISPGVEQAALTLYAAEGDRPPRIEINPDAEYNYLVRLIMNEVNKWLDWTHGETMLNMSDNIVRLIEERDRLKGEVEELKGQPNIFNDEGCQYKCHVVDRLKGEVNSLTAERDAIFEEAKPYLAELAKVKSRLSAMEDVVELGKRSAEHVFVPLAHNNSDFCDICGEYVSGSLHTRVGTVIRNPTLAEWCDALAKLEGRE